MLRLFVRQINSVMYEDYQGFDLIGGSGFWHTRATKMDHCYDDELMLVIL
jgi:hypothetical protein